MASAGFGLLEWGCVCVCDCLCLCVCVCVGECMSAHIYTCVHLSMYTSLSVYETVLYMFVCVQVCIGVGKHVTSGERGKHMW